MGVCVYYIRCVCIKVKDKFPNKTLRERLGIGDITLVLQQSRLQCYGLLSRKEYDDWVKKCMEYEVEGPSQTKRKRKEDLEIGCGKGCLMIRMGVSG